MIEIAVQATALQATAVAAVVLLLVRAGGAWSPVTREGLVAIALLKFLLPATLIGGGLFSALAAPATAVGATTIQSATAVESIGRNFWQIAAGIHMAGSVCVLGFIGASLARCRRLLRGSEQITKDELYERCRALARRVGLRRMPRIWISRAATEPIAFGLLSRHVVLPAAIVRRVDRLDAVIAHEMAHHRRGDLWMFALHRVVVALWWWHPLAWRLGSTLREAVEDGCDDMVVARGVASRDEYCDALVACARASAPTLVALGFADRRHPVGRRIERLAKRPIAGASWRAALVTVAAAGILLPGAPNAQAPLPRLAPRQPQELVSHPSGVDVAMSDVSPPAPIRSARPRRVAVAELSARAIDAVHAATIPVVSPAPQRADTPPQPDPVGEVSPLAPAPVEVRASAIAGDVRDVIVNRIRIVNRIERDGRSKGKQRN